jgi:hypothetical protein
MANKKGLGNYLYEKGYINKNQIEMALDYQNENNHKKLAEILVEINALGDEELLKELAEYLNVKYIMLSKEDTNFLRSNYFYNKKEMLKYNFAPFDLERGKLYVAINDLNNMELKEKIQEIYVRYRIEFYLCFTSMIKKYVIDSYSVDFKTHAPNVKKEKLGEYLLKRGYINQKQLGGILKYQEDYLHKKIGEILLEMKIVDRQTMLKELANYMSAPYEELDTLSPIENLMQYFDISFMKKNNFVPFGQESNNVKIAINSTHEYELKEMIENRLRIEGLRPDFYISLEDSIQGHIDKYINESEKDEE